MSKKMAKAGVPSFQLGDLARHLLEAGVAEISAAASLLADSKGSSRDTVRALSEVSRGIELILKGLVAQVHWTQVFAEPSGASLSDLEAGDFTSVSTQHCLSRLEAMIGLSVGDADRKKLTSIREKRNLYEHFGKLDNIQAVRGSVGAALSAVMQLLAAADDNSFISIELDGMISQLTLELSEFDRFATARMNEVKGALDGFEVFSCPRCTQRAAVIDDGVHCHFCVTRTPGEAFARHYVEVVLGVSRHDVVKDGAFWPQFSCPECGEESLVQREGAKPFICFNCGESWAVRALEPCVYGCGKMMRADDGGTCSDCFAFRMSRDD
jgi:transcription elongation factor Elf1